MSEIFLLLFIYALSQHNFTVLWVTSTVLWLNQKNTYSTKSIPFRATCRMHLYSWTTIFSKQEKYRLQLLECKIYGRATAIYNKYNNKEYKFTTFPLLPYTSFKVAKPKFRYNLQISHPVELVPKPKMFIHQKISIPSWGPVTVSPG